MQPSDIYLSTWPRWQLRPKTSAWPLVVTDPCCNRATEPDIAPCDSTGQDPTTVLGAITSYSHQSVPHYSCISSLPFFVVPTSSCFSFLFYFSTSYLVLLVVSWVSECLGSSQECFQECDMSGLFIMALGSNNLTHGLSLLPRLAWCQTSVHHRLTPCSGPTVIVW